MTEDKTEKKQLPNFKEFASAGKDFDPDAFIGELYSPDDPNMSSTSDLFKKFQTTMQDEQVKTTLQQRRAAVVQAEWEVAAGGTSALDQKAADSLKEQLSNVGLDAATRKMHFGLFYGYSIAECMWAPDGNEIVLEEIKVRKAKRFRFGNDKSLRLLSKDSPEGILMPDQKFWTFTVEADNDDDPYGLGLAHWCYWPVWFKRNGMKFWAISLNKFGSPTPVGKVPPGTEEKAKTEFLRILRSISTDSAVVLPEGMDAELMETIRRVGGDYNEFCKYLDKMVSKIVLGQSATTETAAWRGTADVQKEAGDNIIKEDADLLCESFNQGPAKWLTDWNYPGAAYPKLYKKTQPDNDLNVQVERDTKIYNMGFEPTEDYINQTYGGQWKKRTNSLDQGNPAFAESDDDQDEIDIAVEEALEDWQPLVTPIVEPILNFVENASSLEEIRDGLGDIAKEMNSTALAGKLHNLGFSAHAAGELGIELGEDE